MKISVYFLTDINFNVSGDEHHHGNLNTSTDSSEHGAGGGTLQRTPSNLSAGSSGSSITSPPVGQEPAVHVAPATPPPGDQRAPSVSPATSHNNVASAPLAER